MTDPTAETARALLWRHGLPEDIIDGALCLHAQEMAAAIRAETEALKAHGVLEPHKYRPCRDAANQIDPTCNVDDTDLSEADVDRMMAAGTPVQIVTAPPGTYAAVPPVDRAALRDRIADTVTPFLMNFSDEETAKVNAGEVAVAVLAVLPEPADRAEWDALCRDADRLRKEGEQLRARADRIDAMVQQLCADRAAVLLEAADRIDRMELPQDQVDMFDNGARWATSVLRRLAGEPPATGEAPRCTCDHPVDAHSVYGCEDDCACEWMPKRKPMDPWRILGIADCQTPATHNRGCDCPAAGARQDGQQQP